MERKYQRQSGKGFSIQIEQINGVTQEEGGNQSVSIDNISRGGFRFTTRIDFEIEDRIQVMLKFPDDTVRQVLGRICYSEVVGADDKSVEAKAYGFSILLGFYNLP